MLHSYEFHRKVIMRFWPSVRYYHGVCWSVAGRPGFMFQHSVKSSTRHTRYIQSPMQCVPGFVGRHTATKATLGYYQSENRRIP